MSPLLAALALAVPPPADTPDPTTANDYLIVFAGDYTPYRPTKGHTFIALVRVETAPGCPPRMTDLHSLSWLPVTMKIRALALRAQPECPPETILRARHSPRALTEASGVP